MVYALRNEGGEPIRVLSVDSECGCAKPQIGARTIAPGESTTITVAPEPIEVGERRVNLVVHTDSPAAPDVPLVLRIVGWRRPPYIFRAGGDLQWLDVGDAPEPRTLLVEIIEAKEEPGPPPEVRANGLPLEIGRASAPELRAHVSDPALVARTYAFEIVPDGSTEGRFSGTLAVIDPRDPDRVVTVNALGQWLPALRVSPEYLLLGPDHEGEPSEASLVVLTKSAIADVVIRFQEEDAPLMIEPRSADPKLGQRKYAIRRSGPGAAAGTYHLIVTPVGADEPRMVVPVRVAGGMP